MKALSVAFLTPCDVRVHPSPPPGVRPELCYQLLAPLRVQIGGNLLEIPTAFYSDGGSVPRWAQSLIGVYPTTPKFMRPFFLHDFCYLVGYRGDRKLCDDLLLAGALAEGARRAKAEAVYWGVRAGGWVAWDGYRERSKYELQKNVNSLKPGEPMLRLSVSNWCRNLDGLS